jgi:hypothetical protein
MQMIYTDAATHESTMTTDLALDHSPTDWSKWDPAGEGDGMSEVYV